MKRFIKVIFFLLFATKLQSAEMKPIFTNFINCDQLNVLIDQLVDIAGLEGSIEKVEKILLMFYKIYSSDKEQINLLVTFLQVLENDEPYKSSAQYAKRIIEDGLRNMHNEKNKYSLSCGSKKAKADNLDLSDPIPGSIKFLELLLQKIDTANELSLIRQIILNLTSNTLTKEYLKDITFELAFSAQFSNEDLINLGLIYQALFVKTKKEMINKVMDGLIKLQEKNPDLTELVEGIRDSLNSNQEDEWEGLRSVLIDIRAQVEDSSTKQVIDEVIRCFGEVIKNYSNPEGR
ncbi:MAG: hypothetical protein P4L22_01470 [Candidatus Babeliales bacterium]|nr:hypothetical protein [Candidatus Babeliales bacterium]